MDMLMMTMSLEEIQNSINSVLRENHIISLSTYGVRIWNSSVYYWEDGYDLYCIVTDAQTLRNIHKNPRVAFSISTLKSRCFLQGNGIAYLIGDISENHAYLDRIKVPDMQVSFHQLSGKILKIIPYRFLITDAEKGVGSEEKTIEKRKAGWTLIESGPDTSNPGQNGILSGLRFWLKASRSVSLPLSALPVLIGTALAFIQGSFKPWLFIAALSGGLLAHAGINLFSDYHDFKKGIDTTDCLSSHPGILGNESIEPERLLIAAFLTFTITTLIGGILIANSGWLLLLLGVIGLFGGYFYTGGPVSYKYRGLGELLITLLMGPLMVMGAYFVQTQKVELLPFVVSLSVGLLVGSVTLANNLRDVLDDRKANITTLPMRLGIKKAKVLYYLMIFIPYVIVGAVTLLKPSFYPTLLVILSLPMAFKATNAVKSTKDSAEDFRAKAHQFRYPLNSIKLHLQFNVLLLIGFLLTAILAQ